MPKQKSKAQRIPEKRIKPKIVSVHLDEPTVGWLRELAESKGLAVSTLVRMWVLERLSQEDPPSTGQWV